jgi:transcriptional regulator with GAF, ATPase, and Fis domain
MSDVTNRPDGTAPAREGAADVRARYERLLALDVARQQRRDRLEPLLATIAEALDIREVFPRLSDVIQPVVPHVTVSLALLTPDGQGVKIHVASNYPVGDLPVYRFTADGEAITSAWRSFVTYDSVVVEDGVVRVRTSPDGVEPPHWVELRPGLPWTKLLAGFGVRSVLRVPVRIRGQAIGAISFGAPAPSAYGADDVVLATRIADHIALALAHEKLAEAREQAAQAQERARGLQRRVDTLVDELQAKGSHRALGEAPQWKRVLSEAAQVADTDTTVLITGESGTGKEVTARFIQRASPRANQPFVALNCAALPEQLMEAELFGVERGAFTGAISSRPGRIEQACGGVLFLDEVAEMAPAIQAKFLRVLQEREFQRLGGTRTIEADVRVIAATNRDPRAAVAAGTLREDLYYRLCVFELTLPPLRERPGDILLLADAFLKEIGASVGRPAAGFSEDARDHLLRHPWPGNVRELRNAVERAVILCNGGLVASEHLPTVVASSSRGPFRPAAPSRDEAPGSSLPAGLQLDAVQRDLLEKALASARNNKSKAAKLLGVPRGRFYSLLRRHGLTDARR